MTLTSRAAARRQCSAALVALLTAGVPLWNASAAAPASDMPPPQGAEISGVPAVSALPPPEKTADAPSLDHYPTIKPIRRDRRTGLVVGFNGGVGLPSSELSLESDTQQVVSGLAPASMAFHAGVTIPVGQRWELLPRFGGQLVRQGGGISVVPNAELRARIFPGMPGRKWEEYFVFGVGYGDMVHLVRLRGEGVDGQGVPTAYRDMQRVGAGPMRAMSGMGASWRGSKRVGVNVEGDIYVLAPAWSLHFDLGVSLAIFLW